MNLPLPVTSKLEWLLGSVYFVRQHFWVVVGLGLIAGFGRVIQLGNFGETSNFLYVLLEIIIESALSIGSTGSSGLSLQEANSKVAARIAK